MNWIKCSERLPEKSGEYLVWSSRNKAEIGEWNAENGFWNWFSCDVCLGCDYWMLLPEGPKGDE